MGKDGMKFMQTYQDSLETMNHEAVEYIRGISVVKVFGQTVQSITKFHNAIKSYRKFALAYTMSCKKGMVAFNSVINSSFWCWSLRHSLSASCLRIWRALCRASYST